MPLTDEKLAELRELAAMDRPALLLTTANLARVLDAFPVLLDELAEARAQKGEAIRLYREGVDRLAVAEGKVEILTEEVAELRAQLQGARTLAAELTEMIGASS